MPESAFEDDGPGTGMFETLEEVPVPSAPAETPTAVDEFDEETGGELEAEAPSAADDTEFDEFAQSFVSDGSFEEDEGASAEFDPEKEADELSESMGESLSKASKALAKSAKRSSPKRKLNPRS
jgi:hypothetical protein